jgi:hypothetical protein
MNKVEFLENMQILRLKPNDIIVLKFKDHLSQNVFEQVNEFVKSIGINNKFMVLDRGSEIGILRQEENEWDGLVDLS